MLKLQTNVNMSDYDKRTALHIAASNNFLELAKLLLVQKNINVNALDAFELTPLHDAEIHKFTEMVKLLEENGGVVVHKDLGYVLCQLGADGDIQGLSK